MPTEDFGTYLSEYGAIRDKTAGFVPVRFKASNNWLISLSVGYGTRFLGDASSELHTGKSMEESSIISSNFRFFPWADVKSIFL